MEVKVLALWCAVVLVGACAAPAAPGFDVIDIDVSGGTSPVLIRYDLDNGLAVDSTTWHLSLRTPFHTEATKPHGPRNVLVTAESDRPGGTFLYCTVRINGQVVAAGQETPGDRASCAYTGTPA